MGAAEAAVPARGGCVGCGGSPPASRDEEGSGGCWEDAAAVQHQGKLGRGNSSLLRCVLEKPPLPSSPPMP